MGAGVNGVPTCRSDRLDRMPVRVVCRCNVLNVMATPANAIEVGVTGGKAAGPLIARLTRHAGLTFRRETS